tara:strand:- start:137 stop:1156 length:1020 start_codon:yes stop_codon:yes gene_type:complete
MLRTSGPKIQTLFKKLPMRLKIILQILISLLLLGCSGRDDAVETNIHARIALYDGALSDDGRYAIAATVNHGVGFWDVSSNKLLFRWRHGDDEAKDILHAVISPDNQYAVTAEMRAFVVWDTKSGQSLGYWEMPDEIMAIDISDGGRFVAIGLETGTVHHVDLKTGRRLEYFGHKDKVNSVSLSANGRYVLTGGNDYQAMLWDAQSGQPLHHFKHEHRVTLVELSSDGRYALSASAHGEAKIWHINDGTLQRRLHFGEKPFTLVSARFSENSQYLATGGAARIIQLWDVASGQSIKRWKVRNRNIWRPSGAIVYDVAFSRDNQWLISESSNGLNQRWKL